MLGDTPVDEVTFATGRPPMKQENKYIGELEYLLVRRTGKALDTLFTTVYEPYEAEKQYVESIEKVPMVRDASSKPGLNDAYGAVKVKLKNGRVDYIMYSTNNKVNYTIDGKIDFRGFAGVMSFADKNVAYSYLNDGDILELCGEEKSEAPAAYTGIVKSFTKELASENYIVFTPDKYIECVDDIVGKYVYVKNDNVQNGVYRIEGAEVTGSGDVSLDIGDVTLIRSFVNAENMDLGYIYNIGEGQSLRIPLTTITDSSPVIDEISKSTASANSTVMIEFNAYSPIGKDIFVVGTSLPRGMTIDEKTQTIMWKPSTSQIGENHVALTVSDGVLETSTHFTITVYGSTTGGSSSDSSSGTSGGGSAGAPTPSKPVEDDKDAAGGTPSAGDDDSSLGEGAEKVRFVDLASHTWAADAINALADEGIIKGTSESTFSPAANITRADFALLLVRAFKLTSENTENFADVAASDYFAAELAIARNTGLINGIGDNKFAPRNTITRQDMMTIVYRALETLEVELKTVDVEYADFANVATYAKEAVSALINTGLINGKSGKIAPTDYTTRAEVAVLIKRILDYIK